MCMTGALLAATGCASGAEVHSTGVQILWLGTSGGRAVYGVTDAEVATSRATETGFVVDMSAAGRAGEQWQAAAWTAATVGSMLSGVDPRGVKVSYSLDESIDGPSAGGILTTAVLTTLQGYGPLSQNVTMTGTVLPSGALGPVGGIPAKLRAAAEAGINTVLVPLGQSIAVDPANGRQVVVDDLAAQLEIDVVPVATVQESLGYFGEGVALPGATAGSGDTATPGSYGTPTPGGIAALALSPEANALFTEQANLALQRLLDLPIATVPDVSPPAPGPAAATPPGSAAGSTQPIDAKALEVERQRISSGVALAQTRVGSLLAEGRVIDAFARATLAEREVLAWNARALATEQASTDPVATAQAISTSARALASDADAQVTASLAAAASWPLTYVEQSTALPDALSWATDAWAVARVIESASADVDQPSHLAAAASMLAASRYDVEVYLPASVELARQVGRTPMSDPTGAAEILATYAEVLGDTGDAVQSEATRWQKANNPPADGSAAPSAEATASAGNGTASVFADPLAWEAAVLAELEDRWRREMPEPDSFSSPIDMAGALSTAMSYYVAGSTWAATSQLATGAGPQRTFSKTDWETQVATASRESERTALVAASFGADPGYVLWNEAFGRTSATAATAIGANDAVRLNGLQVQWYGNVQGHMLVSLTNGQLETGA